MSGPEKELPVSQSHLKTPQETKCSRILAFFFFIAGGPLGRQYHLDRKDVRTVRFNTGRAPFCKCYEEVACTRSLNTHLSALPLQASVSSRGVY
jgi:hypothetical protein